MLLEHNNNYFAVAEGIWGIKDILVNMYLVENTVDGTWVLVDAGLKTSGPKIKHFAKELFGDRRPTGIVLTHGHFDHVGSLIDLAEEWDVPVYPHLLEAPYLDGRSAYPPPDPSVGGGMMALLSWMYPKQPIDLGQRLMLLPDDTSVPGLPEWQYIHTPGHAPGHVSLFRERDRALIAGDAFVTTKQESLLSVMLQRKEVNGPPMYFTPDWDAAAASVQLLADLEPEIAATGHGRPMYGAEMRSALRELAELFDVEAMPEHGRYVDHPALMDEEGVRYVPPRDLNPAPAIVGGGALLIMAAYMMRARRVEEMSHA